MIAAARSLATYLIVSLYVLVAAPIGMLLAVLFRWKNLLYILGHGGVKLGLGLSGIKFRVLGAEHIPAYRAAVYCSNHQSHIDPPVLFHALHPQMHILYKAEIDRIPLLARAFRLGGFIAPVVTPWVGLHLNWLWAIGLGGLVCLVGAVLWLWIDPRERTDERPTL